MPRTDHLQYNTLTPVDKLNNALNK